ncbi:uridine kinase [Streptomyces sp. NPDC060194]|uniref:uridine kinase family protein n=1 Tax=Streptomyces sp. NPDC060194 TaxID=3347069 RepID=UPI003651E0AA
MNELGDLAARLLAAPASCGPVRLVAVDGHAGSGKTTFATLLAEALGGAPVLRLDDVATHDELFAWTGRLREQVLAPLSRGGTARYRPYDWVRRAFGPERTIAPSPALVVEGVGAGRSALRPHLAGLLWMDLDARTAWERGRLRDGPSQSAFWDGWVPAERRHFVADPSRPFADVLVRQRTGPHDADRPPGARGYALLPGPGVITERDGAETGR